jgi:hypothetical protein
VPKLLFRLRNVPDDEAQEVRELLDENGVEFYETSAGNWGISLPGIWLADASDYTRARALLDCYQDQRAAQQRANYQALAHAGRPPPSGDYLRPSRWLFACKCWLSRYLSSCRFAYSPGCSSVCHFARISRIIGRCVLGSYIGFLRTLLRGAARIFTPTWQGVFTLFYPYAHPSLQLRAPTL